MTINVLFYNFVDGSGAVGTLDTDALRGTQDFPAGSFARGWTIVSDGAGLFYNDATGEAATGSLRHGAFHTIKSYAPGEFALGWMHAVEFLNVGILLYNRATGAGALNFDPTTKSYNPGEFAPGWTHVVGYGSPILFYNSADGSAAIMVAYDSTPEPGELHVPDAIKTTKVYATGSFSRWTHVVSPGSSGLLFYNSENGAAALGIFSESAFSTATSFPDGSFSTGWTHIVGAGDRLFFYNSATGAGAIGEIYYEEPTGSPPKLRTTMSYDTGAFSADWTHVAVSEDVKNPM